MAYITNTHLLQLIHPKTLVVNDPAHVRNAGVKLWILEFAGLLPPTLISREPADIAVFRADYKDIIIKPLFGNGGAGVFRITAEDSNLASLLEMFGAATREPVMVQQYRPEVRAGDKRVCPRKRRPPPFSRNAGRCLGRERKPARIVSYLQRPKQRCRCHLTCPTQFPAAS